MVRELHIPYGPRVMALQGGNKPVKTISEIPTTKANRCRRFKVNPPFCLAAQPIALFASVSPGGPKVAGFVPSPESSA